MQNESTNADARFCCVPDDGLCFDDERPLRYGATGAGGWPEPDIAGIVMTRR